MLDDRRLWFSPKVLNFIDFQVMSPEELDPKLSQALKIYKHFHSKSLIYKTVSANSRQNIEGIFQGIQQFWFGFILLGLNRLKTSHESDKFATYKNIFEFFDKASEFFVNAGPGLVYIYGKNKPKFDVMNMSEREWIWRVVDSLPSEPTAELERFLYEAGGAALKEDVAQRAQLLLESVFSTYRGRKSSGAYLWPQYRRVAALKVYYMFMETICASDPDASSVLTNYQFHRCALACSAELILATTDRTYTIWLPDVLNRTGITAFDLCKVIEFFLKCEIPKALTWHLSTLMERLLESMIWEKGSSMYDALIITRPHLSKEIVRLGLSMERSTPFGDAVVAASPVSKNSGRYLTAPYWRSLHKEERRMLPFSGFVPSKSKPLPLGSSFVSQNPGGGDMGACAANAVINMMLGKILELSAFRIDTLLRVTGLVQYMYFEETVNCLVQQIISKRIDLFFNRHVDQIVLCSIYSVVNILQPKEMTFKQLLQSYSTLSDTKKLVCDSVFLNREQVPHTHSDEESGQHSVDIATFYTEIFDPCVKPLLADLGLAKDSTLNPCSPIVVEKTLGRAAATIHWLGEKLKIPQHIVDTVHDIVKEILKLQTTLCFNRHIDQIVLCSLYHVPMILKLNISFIELIKNYVKLPDRGPQVIRRVYVDWSQVSHSDKTGVDHVDIVTFYYQIYAVSVTPLLAKIGLLGPASKSDLLPAAYLEKVPSAHFPPPSPTPMSLLKTLELTTDATDTVKELVERLELSQHIKETVHCFMKQVLAHHTALALNRHIDQIALCSIYCVAKASNLKLPFKEVIQAYSKLPRASPQIRSVYIDSQERTGGNQMDISTFYKKIFAPSVKPLLVLTTSKSKSLLQEDQLPGTSSTAPVPRPSVVAPKKYPTPFDGAQPVVRPLAQHN